MTSRSTVEASVAAFLAARNAAQPGPRRSPDPDPTSFGTIAVGLVAEGRVRVEVVSLSPSEYLMLDGPDRANYTPEPVRGAHWRVALRLEW